MQKGDAAQNESRIAEKNYSYKAGHNMSKQVLYDTNIESLMELLSSKDGMVRQKARESIVAAGRPAVPPLTRILLHSPSKQVRWEAGKALGAIGDGRNATMEKT